MECKLEILLLGLEYFIHQIEVLKEDFKQQIEIKHTMLWK